MSQTQTITEEAIELNAAQGVLAQQQAETATLSSSSENIVYPTGLKLTLLSLSLVLGIFLGALDGTIIATAIPSITSQFGSISNIAWYGTAYVITNTSFQSAWGKAYQLYPLKPTLLTAITVFELGNIICATSQSSSMLIFGRLVSGLGAGGTTTGVFVTIALTSPPRLRAASMGIVGGTYGCSSVAGPLMGGALTDGLGWRWCFWVSLPLGGLAAGMLAVSLSQPAHHSPPELPLREKVKQMDLGGASLVTSILVCFVLAMHYGGKRSWGSAKTVCSLLGAAVSAVLFVINEYKMGPKAMLPIQLFRNKRLVPNFAFIFFLAGLFFPLSYILPIQFQSVNNETAAQSGLRLIPLVLGVSVFTLVANGMLTFVRGGYYNPLMTGGSLLGAVGIATICSLGPTATTASWIGYEILIATGIGLALQTPMLANQAAVSAAEVAAATSVTLFCENMGQTLFIAATEAAFTNGLIVGLHKFAVDIDPQVVIDAGATQLRQRFEASKLEGILKAYSNGCQTGFKVNLACGVAALVVSFVNSGPSALRYLKKGRSRSN